MSESFTRLTRDLINAVAPFPLTDYLQDQFEKRALGAFRDGGTVEELKDFVLAQPEVVSHLAEMMPATGDGAQVVAEATPGKSGKGKK